MKMQSLALRTVSALMFGGATLLLVSPLMPAPEPGENADEILAAEIARERNALAEWLRTSPTSILAPPGGCPSRDARR